MYIYILNKYLIYDIKRNISWDIKGSNK